VLPEGWKGVKSVDLYKITINGLEQKESGIKTENGQLILTLARDEAISIVPNGDIMQPQ
jgi:hypothetical protein